MVNNFETKTICILGRQPALGLAELESLYGANHVRPIGEHAQLDIPAEDINFARLGGVIKTARILSTLPYTDWPQIAKYLKEKIPENLPAGETGKFTLGLSVIGLNVRLDNLNRLGLEIKKLVKAAGRPARIVPNKSLELNSAQVLHNGLTRRGAWELLLIRDGQQTLIAQTLFVQDIEAYARRDQARPARDSRVGMLPPKLAQILINLAAGKIEQNPENHERRHRIRVLDPFCGTGVILQEAMLMGYSVVGTDIEPRMIEYTQDNLQWLVSNNPAIETQAVVEVSDATTQQWPGFSAVASEVYLGRPLTKLPGQAELKKIISDVNTITKKFLTNISTQMKSGQRMSLAVPAWRISEAQGSKSASAALGFGEKRSKAYTEYGARASQPETTRGTASASRVAGSADKQAGARFISLPLLDHLTEMGYNYLDLSHARHEDLIYYRADQTVARQLIILEKK